MNSTLTHLSYMLKILSRIITNQNIRVCTKLVLTIKQIFPKLKDPIEPKQRQGVTYKIRCLR